MADPNDDDLLDALRAAAGDRLTDDQLSAVAAVFDVLSAPRARHTASEKGRLEAERRHPEIRGAAAAGRAEAERRFGTRSGDAA
jgi:hypothetical protein